MSKIIVDILNFWYIISLICSTYPSGISTPSLGINVSCTVLYLPLSVIKLLSENITICSLLFDNISFQINNNDKVGIIGVNGAGKSTLFNILLGNLTPDSGTITLNTKINLGYLPQVIMDDASNKDLRK